MFKILIYKLTMVLMMSTIVSQNRIIVDDYIEKADCNFILSSMNFLNKQRCVQFVFGDERHSIECVKTIMENRVNVSFYTRSVAWLLNRNLYLEETPSTIKNRQSTKFCEFFLIILKDVVSLQSVLKSIQHSASVVTLFPYSKLYFMLTDGHSQFWSTETFTEISNFFRENAQFGYMYQLQANTSRIELIDFLSLNGTVHSNLIHPIVNQRNENKIFRVTLFNCNPFVVYVDDERLRFDGIEYRLIREITKNWQIQYILRDKAPSGKTSFETMMDDLRNYTADLALCSVWLSGFDKRMDTSTYYNRQCGTLLVPKPKHLSEITAIYRTLKFLVWLTFGLFFFTTIILLRTGAAIHVTGTPYVSLSETFLDVMSIATAHGVSSLCTPQSKSTKILLMSWIFVCSLVGICYTTIYTSFLTKPGYEKLINSIEDFVENDMYYGTFQIAPDHVSSLRASSNPAYNELGRRIRAFSSISNTETALASRKFGVYGGISNHNYFVSPTWVKHLHLLQSFRLMKDVCIFNYYTVFALQKFSPYTELFSQYALQFQEHGIKDYWFKTVYRQSKTSFDTFFEDYPRESKEPAALHFASISGALLVLLVSHALSSVVFLCELGFKKFMRCNQVQY